MACTIGHDRQSEYEDRPRGSTEYRVESVAIGSVRMLLVTRLCIAAAAVVVGIASLSVCGAANVSIRPSQVSTGTSTDVSSDRSSDATTDLKYDVIPSPYLSSPLLSGPIGEVYSLHLYHLHTGESLDVIYRIGDRYIPEALDRLNHFLRDHRTQDASHYDPKEFDLLHSIMVRLGRPEGIIDIVCGYRTPWSNAFLRQGRSSSGVAEHSQHVEAKAIDIRVPGVQTAKLRDTAESFEAGGVGYYPVSQFVHVDVGPVRTWSFGAASRTSSSQHTATLRHHSRNRHGVIHHVGD